MRQLASERSVLRTIIHPDIVKVLDFLEDSKGYYVISEFMEGGQLFERLLDMETITEGHVRTVVKQILLALNYMHGKGIIHRGLTQESIYLQTKNSQDLDIKVGDFGSAALTKDICPLLDSVMMYTAPEILKKITYDARVDIWSLGVMAYVMF